MAELVTSQPGLSPAVTTRTVSKVYELTGNETTGDHFVVGELEKGEQAIRSGVYCDNTLGWTTSGTISLGTTSSNAALLAAVSCDAAAVNVAGPAVTDLALETDSTEQIIGTFTIVGTYNGTVGAKLSVWVEILTFTGVV